VPLLHEIKKSTFGRLIFVMSNFDIQTLRALISVDLPFLA